MIKKLLKPILFGIIIIFSTYSISITQFGKTPEKRQITDLTGEKFEIPKDLKKIACFFGPSFEKVFMLGYADKVAAIGVKQSPWAYYIYPRLNEMDPFRARLDPSPEILLKSGFDLVFFWNKSARAKLLSAGIPAVCSQVSSKAESLPEFFSKYKKEIRFYGEVLGADAIKKAEQYCTYLEEKTKGIISVISPLAKDRRPKVYFAEFDELKTQGKFSTDYWLIELAGGKLVSEHMGQHYITISLEQVINLNPEIIFVVEPASCDRIKNNSQWSTIKAVKNNKIYVTPSGFFHAAHGSTEIVILTMYLAKTLHPDLFPDLNLQKEIMYYYKEFYNYKLSKLEADRILKHLPPEKIK